MDTETVALVGFYGMLAVIFAVGAIGAFFFYIAPKMVKEFDEQQAAAAQK